jgi:hypothetical protein
MWIKYEGELINLEKISTIRKSISETSNTIILSDSGKEIKKLVFKDLDDLEDYFNFIENSLAPTKGIKIRGEKGLWKK